MWLCLVNLSLYIKKAINIQISNLSREFKSRRIGKSCKKQKVKISPPKKPKKPCKNKAFGIGCIFDL